MGLRVLGMAVREWWGLVAHRGADGEHSVAKSCKGWVGVCIGSDKLGGRENAFEPPALGTSRARCGSAVLVIARQKCCESSTDDNRRTGSRGFVFVGGRVQMADETGELVAEVHAGVAGAACARAVLWRREFPECL